MLESEPVVMESPLSVDMCMSHITHRLKDHLPTMWFGSVKSADFDAKFTDEDEPYFVLVLERGFVGVMLRGTLQPYNAGTKLVGELSPTPLTKIFVAFPAGIGVLVMLISLCGNPLVGMLGGLYFIGFAAAFYFHQRKFYGNMLITGLEDTLRVKSE
jgi:hypothetical protein